MTKQKIGNFTYALFFSLEEKVKYEQYKSKFKGFYTERFINNGYCLEITKIRL